MADITLCTSNNCPYKSTCYRKKAEADRRWQSYANFEYNCNESSGFEDFIPMAETEQN